MICAPAGEPPGDPRFERAVTPHPAIPSIAFASTRLIPGSFGLRLVLPGNLSMTVPVSVLPDWLAILVVTRESNRAFEIHHYQMPLREIPGLRVRREEAYAFATLRRVELMQRMVQAGRLSPTKLEVEALLYDKWRDPSAGCLGAYLLLRSGQHEGLRIPANNLVLHFPGLPDGHLLMALVEERSGRPAAAAKLLQNAADLGLPVYRDGLVAMVQAAQRLKLRTVFDQASAWLEHVPDGSLFSLASARHEMPTGTLN